MPAAFQIPSAVRPPGTAPASDRAPLPGAQCGPSFADLLQRGQSTHGVLARPTEPAPTHTEAPPGDGVDHNAEAPAEALPAAPTATTQAAGKPAPRTREKATPAAPAQPPSPCVPITDGTASEATDARRPADAFAGDATPSALPIADLRDWLATLKLPEQAVTEAADPAAKDLVATAARRPADDFAGALPIADVRDGLATARLPEQAVTEAADAAGLGPPVAPANRPDLLQGAAGTEDAHSEGKGTVTAPDRARPAGQASELTALASAERRPAPAERPIVRDPAPGPLSGAGGAVPRGFDPGTLAPIALPAPLYSPEFAQVLGAQVSLLARDGVQQAELRLHPAEMGPISVQIKIDGKEARVDFSAGTAATREVIERGLPELASALREQGLTLAGGGVFQHSHESRDKPDREPTGAGGRSKQRASTDGARAARTVALPAPQGMLDLYA